MDMMSIEKNKTETQPPTQAERIPTALFENPSKLKIAGTALALGGLAAIGYDLQASGLTYSIPDYPRLATDSMKHPVLGYTGAAVGHVATLATAKLRRKPISTETQFKAMFAGATIANFGAEQAQSMFYAIDEYKSYFSAQHMPETVKDYVFALSGLALYRSQSKQKKFQMSRWSQFLITLKVARQKRLYRTA
jgi:hypothetical protein